MNWRIVLTLNTVRDQGATLQGEFELGHSVIQPAQLIPKFWYLCPLPLYTPFKKFFHLQA